MSSRSASRRVPVLSSAGGRHADAMLRSARRTPASAVEFALQTVGALTIVVTSASALARSAMLLKTIQSSMPSRCASKRTVEMGTPTLPRRGPGSAARREAAAGREGRSGEGAARGAERERRARACAQQTHT